MKPRGRHLLELAVPAAGIAVAIAYFLWWEISHLGNYAYTTAIYPMDPADEWRYTACSQLVAHGYTLFDQVYSAQPPLLFLSLAAAMRLAGDGIGSARLVEMAFGLIALGGTAWLAWTLAGRWAGAATALLLAASPGFLAYSHAVEAEVPMMAMATLSLALAALYHRESKLLWPLLAGIALAAALLLKLFAIETVVPATWLIVSATRVSWAERTRAVSLLFLAAAAPLAIDFALFSPVAQWQQVVTLHDVVAGMALPGLIPPLTIFREFLALDAGLTALAVAGIVVLAVRRRAQCAFVLLWLGGSVLMLYLFRPLFPHHAAILTSALAVSGGLAVDFGLRALIPSLYRKQEPTYGTGAYSGPVPGTDPAESGGISRKRLTGVTVPVLLAVLIYVLTLPRLAHADRHLLLAGPPFASDPLVGWVDRHSRPAQFVATDDLELADTSGRLVPPPLCDPSNVRLQAGYLSPDDLISATERYQPQLVIPRTGTYAQVPAYIFWLQHVYRPESAPDGVTAYARR